MLASMTISKNISTENNVKPSQILPSFLQPGYLCNRDTCDQPGEMLSFRLRDSVVVVFGMMPDRSPPSPWLVVRLKVTYCALGSGDRKQIFYNAITLGDA